MRPRIRAIAVAVSAAFALLAVGCSQPQTPAPAPARPTASGAAAPCAYPASGEAAKPVQPPTTTGVVTSGKTTFVLKTNAGDVKITMDRSKAPCTVNSFESLAKQGYFDGTSCHRLADSGIFVLQCGDPTGTGSGGPGYAFPDEEQGVRSYKRGVVAMANAGPGTNGSQFFLIWNDSTEVLDAQPNYTIFGQMDLESVNVVAQIAAEGQDGSNPDGTGKPNNPAEIISVSRK